VTDDNPPEPVHACRDCGEEYRADILVCADCGGEVVWRDPRQAAQAAAAAPAPEPPGESGHILFSSPRMADLLPMAERLRENAIEHQLYEQPVRAGGSRSWAVVVREDDAPRAHELIADLHGPHETGGDMRAVVTQFDETHGYLRCPACGTSLGSGAHECPECGLVVGGEEAAQEPGD
jgi:hypothetical protein